MTFLTGYYENFVDEKGRVILPKKFKDKIGCDLTITRGLNECVYLFTADGWNEFRSKLIELTFSQGYNLGYFFNPYTEDVTPDKQGRIQISQRLRQKAKIEGKAVIIGNGNRIEIWNPELFEQMEQSMSTDKIIASMDELGF